MAIDVGASCIDRDTTTDAGYTLVGLENPANATGTIDYICIYSYSANYLTGLEVASFGADGNVLTTTGNVALADTGVGVTEYNAGAPGDFTAFNINSGDYIGLYYSGGLIERDSSGSGYWVKSGDNIPASGVDFGSYSADRTISLYATGTEAGGGPTPGWNKLAYTSEPPTPNAWNQLKREVGTGWKKILYE